MRPYPLLTLLAAVILTTAARSDPEPAHPGDDFVDRMGVCTHWGYGDTPYGFAYDKVKALLGDLGLRHVRDGYHERELDLYKSFGIRTTVIFGPGAKSPANQIAVLKPNVAAFDTIEGPNEVDIFAQNSAYMGKTFPEGAKAFQTDLYAAVKGDPVLAPLGVIAPSTARSDSNSKLAPLNAFDYTVMHSYAGGGMPSRSLEGNEGSNVLNAARIQGPNTVVKPIIVTESGYHTALGGSGVIAGVQPGVSEKVQAKYIGRHFAEYFNAGIRRTFTYELIDEFPDYDKSEYEGTNAEACFGIIKRDLTPKPAYYTEKNLIALLGEAKWDAAKQQWNKPNFLPRALDFALGGDIKNVHHTLLQKSTGDFYLLLWQEVPSFDTKTKKEIINPTVTVDLATRTPLQSITVYDADFKPLPSGMPANPSSVRLQIPDEIMIVKLTPKAPHDTILPSAPTNIAAETTGNAVILSWPAADRREGIAGYFVSRLGRYLGHTALHAFTDTTVLPGTGYTYEIQSYDTAGNVSPPATKIAMTPAQFPDLVVTDIALAPANAKAGQDVTFSATVTNKGNGATPAGVVQGVAFFVDGQFVAWSDTGRGPLAPGATTVLRANNGPQGHATWTLTPGHHTVSATVDDVNRINESDEANNKLDKAFDAW